MKLKLLVLLTSLPAIAVALVAANTSAERAPTRIVHHARTCNPQPPVTITMESADANGDPLSADLVGPISLHIDATTSVDDATVDVSCELSAKLKVIDGATDYAEEGQGMDFMLSKETPDPQWVLVTATVRRSDGEVFVAQQFLGTPPEPVIVGATLVDDVLLLPSEQQ